MSDPTVDFAINLLGNVLGELLAHLVEAAGRAVGSRRPARELGADYTTRLANALARDFDRLRGTELADVSPQDWDAAVELLRACLAAAAPLDETVALEASLRPEGLEAIVRSRGESVLRAAAQSPSARSAFDLLLASACAAILEILMTLPGFSERLPEAIYRQADAAGRAIDRLAARDELQAAAAANRFERRYLSYLEQTLGRFELFGVIRGRAPRHQTFDDAYVSPAVARTVGMDQVPEAEDELTGAGIDVANAFADRRRVVLRGSAGTGKTTLLQWLAANGAAGRLAGDSQLWGRKVVPFLIHLRDFANGELPAVEELPASAARPIDGERPPGWVISRFQDGTAVLLVDGVDEVAAERRDRVRTWIEGIVVAYPAARYIVTARPFAVPEGWLGASGFEAFDLLPLSAKGIRDFLACWHAAARREHSQDSQMRQWLDDCENSLAELMSTRPELRRLAGSPLLCGLLCALYQDRNMDLPRDRKSLFDAALDLLLVRWDEQRGIKIADGAALSKEEQLVLLQRFAYSLVKNQDLVVSKDEAVRRFAHAMRGLRPQHSDPDVVLRRTLERTGLLQEPRTDHIQFVHRTFRDYLAAKEVVDSRDLAFLIDHAHLDQWQDVMIMSVAHARPHEREELLRALLRGNAEVRRDPRVADRLHLLAAACLEQAHVMDTDEVRRMVQQAAARLIPPSSLDEADFLARAGSFVLDLLPGPAGLTDYQAACVVRTIAHIGGEASRERIRQFAAVDQSMVIDELLRAWRDSDDPEDYARTVLAGIEFGDREVRVRGWHRVRYLSHLSELRHLVCPGDLTPLDPIAAMPKLRKLELIQNSVLRDLSPLADAPALESLSLSWCTSLRSITPLSASASLRTLHLTGCTLLRDLSPLVDSAITELTVHLMNCDFGSLAGAPLTAITIRDRRLAQALDALPADLPLRSLTLDNLPADRNLRGVERWPRIEQLTFSGIPYPDEIRCLARLPRLSRIILSAPAPADQLNSLRDALPAVEIIPPPQPTSSTH